MTIEMLLGLPSSGKSTYAAKRAKEGAIICNDDDIVLGCHSRNYKLYDKNLKDLYKAVEYTILREASILHKDVVIDSPNQDLKRRARYIRWAKILNAPIFVTCFKIEEPYILAERRYWSDSRGHSYEYWLRVIESQLKEYTPPSLDEGFSQIRHVHFETCFMTPKEEFEARQ